RRPAMFHQRDQARIQQARLFRRGEPVGDQEIQRGGETVHAHELMDQILAANGDRGFVGGGDPGEGGVLCHAQAFASEKSSSFVLYSLRGMLPYDTSETATVATSFARIADAMASASAGSAC